MTPVETQVAILPDKAVTKSGEFIVPDTAQHKPLRGTVVAVGPGSFAKDTGLFIPMQVKEGDIVHFSKYATTEIEYEGEKIIICQQAQILIIE